MAKKSRSRRQTAAKKTASGYAQASGTNEFANTPADEEFFTIAEVAEHLGVCSRTVRRWIERGELVAHYFVGVVRLAKSDMHAFIARHRGI